MKKFIQKYKYLFLIFISSSLLFYKSLFVFFTNDDFFFLKISQAKNVLQFLNFFNLIKSPDGFGMYRPLTTQAFYFLSWKFFNLDPVPLHIISFLTFFAVIYLIYKLVYELIKNEKIAMISSFLYAVSATHFGHLYYLATFQELGVTLFVLLSCLSFLKNKNSGSLIFFILALMSKETAVVTPILLALIYAFQNRTSNKLINFKILLLKLLPFLICLFVYLFIRIFFYGFATGDSYVWDFSILKLINTSFWYLFWSFNIPESLVDFIGPGLKVNPNLFLYWSKEMIPIFVSFSVQLTLLAYVLFKSLRERLEHDIHERDLVSTFCIAWFLISLLPVIFLPIHKFTFYLTLPLFAIAFRIAYLLVTSKVNNFFIFLFLSAWTLTSFLTLQFTFDTNWISQSELISKRVMEYFIVNENKIGNQTVVFEDTRSDSVLPYSPTSTIRTILSDKNFFYVFFPNIANKVSYSGVGEYKINSRQFLGY